MRSYAGTTAAIGENLWFFPADSTGNGQLQILPFLPSKGGGLGAFPLGTSHIHASFVIAPSCGGHFRALPQRFISGRTEAAFKMPPKRKTASQEENVNLGPATR